MRRQGDAGADFVARARTDLEALLCSHDQAPRPAKPGETVWGNKFVTHSDSKQPILK